MSQVCARLALWSVLSAFLGFSAQAFGANHIVHIHEVFSDADGTIQFIELQADANGQTVFTPMILVAEIENDDGDIEETTIFDFTASVSWGNDDIMLIASESYEDEFTDTPPDFVFEDGLVPLDSGRIVFKRDTTGTIIDAVAYGDFPEDDNGTYDTPAETLPSDGCTSLVRDQVVSNDDNAEDWITAIASPENLDGDTEDLSCDPITNDFLRGDFDSNGTVVALIDALKLLEFGFQNGPPPTCEDAADVNGDGTISAILDALVLLQWAFVFGDEPPDPGPTRCGPDPEPDDGEEPDDLDCELPADDCLTP